MDHIGEYFLRLQHNYSKKKKTFLKTLKIDKKSATKCYKISNMGWYSHIGVILKCGPLYPIINQTWPLNTWLRSE